MSNPTLDIELHGGLRLVPRNIGAGDLGTPERVRYLVANHPKHKELKKQGWRVAQFGKHDDRAESFGRKVVFVKEETEQLDELSKEKLQPVADRAAKRRKIVPFMGAVARMSGYYMPKKNLKITPGGGEYRWSSPYSGKKSMKEETEQLDEDARSLRSNLIRQIYEAEYALKKGNNPWKVWKQTRGETGQSMGRI